MILHPASPSKYGRNHFLRTKDEFIQKLKAVEAGNGKRQSGQCAITSLPVSLANAKAAENLAKKVVRRELSCDRPERDLRQT